MLARVVQGVERVEELLERLFLALQELNVVDQEDVDVAIVALERELAVVADRVDEVVGELLGVDVAHASLGLEVTRVVADRVKEVRLAETGVAVDEERVVRLAGGLGHRERGGVREAVGGPDDERVEGVAGVEVGIVGARTLALALGRPAGLGLVVDLAPCREGRRRRLR